MSQKSAWRFLLFHILVLLVIAVPARADLSQKQARKAITRIVGFTLPNKAVRVRTVNSTSNNLAEVSAELELVFRLVQSTNGEWRIKDIRSGQDRWEDIDLLAKAAKFQLIPAKCPRSEMEPTSQNLTVRRARCLVADLFGVTLPSDAVRIREISSLGLPIGTETSALAITLVQSDFRLRKDANGWQVVDFRNGSGSWISLEGVAGAIDEAKRLQATEELKTMAGALDSFRKDRGYYVTSDKHSVLIDHLSPHYLTRVIRVDPWHHPYRYQGERDQFTLRSSGPDGKPDTPDDVTVSSSSR